MAASPRDAVLFTLLTLQDERSAWDLAHALGLDSNDVWDRLATAYEKIDPQAVLPVHTHLVEHELTVAGAQHYKAAAKRLAKMRTLARGTDAEPRVDQLIGELRETQPTSTTPPTRVRSSQPALKCFT